MNSSSHFSADSSVPLRKVETLEAAAACLKNEYMLLYQRICTLDSSCLGVKVNDSSALPMMDLLHRVVEDTSLVSLCDYLRLIDKNNFDGGYLFHDLSGIGLYALAYQIANVWAESNLFLAYKAVVVLPIEQMHRLATSDPTYSPKLEDIFTTWGIDISIEEISCKDVLVIVSGYSERLKSYKNQGKISAEVWFEFVRKFFPNYIVVSNMLLPGYEKKTLTLSLKPFDLRVDHLKGRASSTIFKSSTCYIPGKLIIEEAQAAIEQAFFESVGGNEEGSVWTTKKWHDQAKRLVKHGGEIEESKVKLKHKYKPFTTQKFIASLMENSVGDTDDIPELLENPVQWFAAAITYNSSDYASYRIANNFISRKPNNYIDNLGCIEVIASRIRDKRFLGANESHNTDTELMTILRELWKEESFRLSSDDSWLLGKIDQKKRELYQSNLDKKKLERYKRGIKALKNPNEEVFEFSVGPPYEKIHHDLLGELEGMDESDITKMVVAIFTGKENVERAHNLTLGISAIMLAESARYPTSFIANLCFLDIVRNTSIDIGNSLWKRFFGHKNDCNSYKIESVNDGVVFDIMRVLGGVHPMTQGNSHNQTKKDSVQPKYGMHLVDFKIHILLMKWLSVILEKEQDITPHLSGEIVFEPEAESEEYVTNLSDYFFLKEEGALNPNIFDRFSRRLDSFDFMLMEKVPLREKFPNDFTDDYSAEESGMLPNTSKLASFIHENSIFLRKKFPCEIQDKKHKVRLTNHSMNLSITQRFEHAMQIKLGEGVEAGAYFILQILARDPDFYQLYFFLSRSYFYQEFTSSSELMFNLEKAIGYASSFLALAAKKDSLYYITLCVRIKCYYRLGNSPEVANLLEIDINEYLSSYCDPSDPDYWRVFAFRAILWQQLARDDSAIYNDFKVFLENIEPEDSGPYAEAIKYMQSKLKHITKALIANQDDSCLLFESADIYRYLRNYHQMLYKSLLAVVAVKKNEPQLPGNIKEQFLANLQKYYDFHKFDYLEAYGEELWGKILNGDIQKQKDLGQFLSEKGGSETLSAGNACGIISVQASLFPVANAVSNIPLSETSHVTPNTD